MPPITFGIQLRPLLSAPALVNLTVRLEQLGFDHISMPDHMLFPKAAPGLDPWILLAGTAARTKRVTVGTNVSDPHRLHPAVLAHRVATLDQLSRGRVVLGLGAGEAMNLDPFGIPWNRPVARLKECIHILRHLWDKTEPLDFQGEFFTLKQARLDVRPYRNRRIPIHLAALGPVMQKLAGELCDGWAPVVVPPQHYEALFAPIEAAAQAAGRPGAVRRTAIVPLSLSGTQEQLLKAARRFALDLVWPGMLPRMGIHLDLPKDLVDVHYQSLNPCDPEDLRKFEALAKLIPDDVLLQFITFGDPPAIRRRLKEYVDAGVTHFNIINASADPTGSMLTLATEVVPYFTGRRPPLLATVAHWVSPWLPRSAEERAAIKRLLGS